MGRQKSAESIVVPKRPVRRLEHDDKCRSLNFDDEGDAAIVWLKCPILAQSIADGIRE